jgi:hypothetical protein
VVGGGTTRRRVSWAIIGLGTVVLLTVLAAVLLWLSMTNRFDGLLHASLLLVLATLLAVGVLFTQASRSAQGGLSLTAGPAAPWSPIFASLATLLTLFLLKDPGSDASRRVAVLVGLGLGLVAWLIAIWSMTFRSRPENVNPRVYADLLEKHRAVSTRLDRLQSGHQASDAFVEAQKHLAWASRELRVDGIPTQAGVDWASGYAYINVWMALHRAEEALLRLASDEELAEVMLHDRLRTSGSRLTNMRLKVRAVHRDLLTVAKASSGSLTRTEVVAIRQAVNEFRDSRWDGLARARNRLNYTTLITSWTVYLVLVVAIGLRAPREALAAGAIFFLIGALIGLFAQLRADAQAEEAVEDFGMAAARLRQTLIASGLAAIGGIVVTAMVTDATALQRGEAPPSLADVFAVNTNPAHLLVAAVFGLSPQLLIERLTASADRYRADLKQTGTGDADVATGVPIADADG